MNAQDYNGTQSFYLALLEFLLNAKRHIIAVGDEFGLTSVQAMTLLLIDEQKPRPMKSLCSLYHCDASNITGIIDGLEQKQLVSRQNDAMDRRVKTIQLEKEGRIMQQLILARLSNNGDFPFESSLDPSERADFIRIVEKLAASRRMTASESL